jgi:hypothetical protein
MFFRNVDNDLQDSAAVILQKTVIFTSYVVEFITGKEELFFFIWVSLWHRRLPVIAKEKGGGG